MSRPRRTGTGEYRVPAKIISFIVPAETKEFFKTVCETMRKTHQEVMGEALDTYLRAKGMPPLNVRSMRDEQEL